MTAEKDRGAAEPPRRTNIFETATQSVARDGIPVPPGGTFQGRPPPKARRTYDDNGADSLEERWSAESRCDRRAEVTEVDWQTRTGTLRLGFEVTDGRPFSFVPGNFVRLERHVEGKGFRRGTYCIASPPSEYHRFDLLVRVVPGGRMSEHLASLRLGDEVAFRGPSGRSMVRRAGSNGIVLLATGVGVGPFQCLASYLLRAGYDSRIDLFWGLRAVDDVCLTAGLDRLAGRYSNFTYRISLSQPPSGWTGLRGRITESVPPLLTDVGRRQYLLTGNGAMVAEMAAALREVGVATGAIYEEPYFNSRHVPGRATVQAIAGRFEAANRPGMPRR